MIEDALAGKIDLIVTKSISRFARNTIDTLTTVRQLKEKGIEVFFEKENIYTLDSKGELLITIMSSIAQEESRSISENVTWRQRKRFADGKVSLPYKNFLGDRRGKDGKPQIVESEAKIVRKIYRLFLEGLTPTHIARTLTEEGIPTPGGKVIWQNSTVESILTNEKYKGDALLQKKYTVDFLSKKQKINEGEVPQYYVEGSHEGIVTAEVFDLVQYELHRRKSLNTSYCSKSPFSSRLICGECGGTYGAKYGIPITSIGEKFINAIIDTADTPVTVLAAKPRISRLMKLKAHLSEHLTAALKTGEKLSITALRQFLKYWTLPN